MAGIVDRALDMSRTREGREILMGLIEDSRLFQAGEQGDPLIMAYDNGRRKLGSALFARLLTDGGQTLSIMFRERFERIEASKKRAKENDD